MRVDLFDFDLPPEIRDMHPQILLRTSELSSPHCIEDLLVSQRLTRRRQKCGQNLPFDRREMQLRPLARDLSVDRVDQQVANRDRPSVA